METAENRASHAIWGNIVFWIDALRGKKKKNKAKRRRCELSAIPTPTLFASRRWGEQIGLEGKKEKGENIKPP